MNVIFNYASVETAIKILNEATKLDPAAMQELIDKRTFCNVDIANHKTIQVMVIGEDCYKVGLLGIINGIFGADFRGFGYISAIFENGKLTGFQRTAESQDEITE